MFLYVSVKLIENDLCKIVSEEHHLKGQIIRFKQMDYYFQYPCFIFETEDNKRITLNCESQFVTLPYKSSIEFLINLALQTNDKIWFNELVYKLKYESE